MKNTWIKSVLLPVCVLGMAIVAHAQANFSDWPYSMPLKLNTSSTGANVGGEVDSFPVLIRLTGVNFDFNIPKSDGSDLRFARSVPNVGLTELPYQIERWDKTNKVAEIWVLVDKILGNDDSQFIIMYWGNLLATASTAGPVFKTTNGFRAVYHINESPGTTSGGFIDATGNYNATGHGVPSNDWSPGIIGNAQWFDGVEDYITLPNTIPNSGTATVSAWYQIDALKANAGILSNGQWSTGAVHFKNNNGPLVDSANGGTPFSSSTQSAGNNWYYGTYTYSQTGTAMKLYVNGTQVGLSTTPNAVWLGTNLQIAHEYTSSSSRFFNGTIDEARVESVVRSSDWIKLCYENQKATQTLVQLQSQYVPAAGGEVYGDIDMAGYDLLNASVVVTKKWRVPAPDYVFDAGYKVPSLLETEQYIKANGHLPGVPSAKEMEAKGMDLGTMNMVLLKQVEHMQLYILQQEKRIEKLEKTTR